MRSVAEAIRDIGDVEVARIGEAGAIRICKLALPAVCAAGLLNAARLKGMKFVAAQPELRYLSGEIPLNEVPSTMVDKYFQIPSSPPYALLRRLARPRFWAPAHRLPLIWLAPRATAIAHNDLLIDRIHATGDRVNYLDAPGLYRHALAGLDPGRVDRERAEAAADVIAAALPVPRGLDAALDRRLRAYLSEVVRSVCVRAATGLAAMRTVRRLPMRIWNGTGGNLPAAMIASEVIARGGQVTGFDHPTGRGLERYYEFTALHELSMCTRFVLPTPGTAERLVGQGVHRLQHPRRRTEILGGRGYPRIRKLDLIRKTKRAASQRLRVTYASPMFRGWRQNLPAVTPDTVQLDWELRLIEILKRMPIELRCRPHPEGICQGKTHPLAQVMALESRPFEDLIPTTDVFLMDYFRSSTFWIALCTNRPIVLVELGYSYLDTFFTEEIRPAIERRVRFVRAHNDDRNRFVVDEQELEHSILTGPETVTSAELQTLLIGETR